MAEAPGLRVKIFAVRPGCFVSRVCHLSGAGSFRGERALIRARSRLKVAGLWPVSEAISSLAATNELILIERTLCPLFRRPCCRTRSRHGAALPGPDIGLCAGMSCARAGPVALPDSGVGPGVFVGGRCAGPVRCADRFVRDTGSRSRWAVVLRCCSGVSAFIVSV